MAECSQEDIDLRESDDSDSSLELSLEIEDVEERCHDVSPVGKIKPYRYEPYLPLDDVVGERAGNTKQECSSSHSVEDDRLQNTEW